MFNSLKLHFILSILFLTNVFSISNPNIDLNIKDFIIAQESLDINSLSTDDLSDLAIKTEKIAKILENIKKIKSTESNNKKFLWVSNLKNNLLNNFIMDGVKTGLKGIVEKVVVPTTLQASLILAIISRFTGIPFPDLVMMVWRLVFPQKTLIKDVVVNGPNKYNYDDTFLGGYAYYYDNFFSILGQSYCKIPFVDC
jgi:hypothetical protein